MRIVYDGRWLGRTGIGRYAEELLRELQELDHDNEYLVLLLPKYYDTWKPTAPNFCAIRTTCEVYTWQEQMLLDAQIARLQPDLVHFTSFNLPIFYPGRFVATIHDLTLVNFKNVRGHGLKRLVYEFKYGVMLAILRAVAQRAAAIMVPTQFVRDDLAQHYPATIEKTRVTYEATTPNLAKPATITRFPVPERFVLYVGNYYPYKNVGRMVEAFAQSKARQQGVKLMLCGQTPHFLDQIVARIHELDITDDVIITGRVTDGELATLYPSAELALLFSLSEGFGLPALEAMTYGTPVLAARASCLPEVLGDAAAYCDPIDVADMAQQLDALVEDKALRERLAAAGYARVKQFSWRRMAEQTLAVYERAGQK